MMRKSLLTNGCRAELLWVWSLYIEECDRSKSSERATFSSVMALMLASGHDFSRAEKAQQRSGL
jgi:hypothetical protein